MKNESQLALDRLALQYANELAAKQPRGDYTIAQLPNLATVSTSDLVPVFHNNQTYQATAGSLMAAGVGPGYYISNGATYNGTQWIASATTASIILVNSNSIAFYSDTGLTVSSAYVPTQVATLSSAGALTTTGIVDTGTLAVTGASTLTGNVTTSGNVSVGGTLGVTGNTTVSNLTVSGTFTLSSGLTAQYLASGAIWNGSQWIATATSATIVATAASTITLYANSGLTVSSPFSPTQIAQYDSSGDLTLSGGLTATTGTFSGEITALASPKLTVNAITAQSAAPSGTIAFAGALGGGGGKSYAVVLNGQVQCSAVGQNIVLTSSGSTFPDSPMTITMGTNSGDQKSTCFMMVGTATGAQTPSVVWQVSADTVSVDLVILAFPTS